MEGELTNIFQTFNLKRINDQRLKSKMMKAINFNFVSYHPLDLIIRLVKIRQRDSEFKSRCRMNNKKFYFMQLYVTLIYLHLSLYNQEAFEVQ